MKVIVEAKRENETLRFAIIPYEHQLAQEWYQEIKRLSESNIGILEKNRIYSLNHTWSEKKILEDIKSCCEKINNWKPLVAPIDFSNPNQDVMNELHLYFEKMVGLDNARSTTLKDAPEEVSQAIVDFNILIHRYECFNRHKNFNFYGRIVTTFEEKNKRPIREEDFSLFTYAYEQGEVTLNYCHVGKPLLDVIWDDDHHVSLENILPQHKWCADFIIFFTRGPAFRKAYPEKVESFWKENEALMNQLDFHRNDPRLAFGRLPVGRLEEDPVSLKKRIFGITEVIRVFVEE